MIKPYYVHAQWDSDAQVWVASGDEVPGLAIEADTIEAMAQKLSLIVPELLQCNGLSDSKSQHSISIRFRA